MTIRFIDHSTIEFVVGKKDPLCYRCTLVRSHNYACCAPVYTVQRLGRGCHNFFPVLRGDGTKTAPPVEIFDQPPGEMSSDRVKLVDDVRGYAVLSPKGAVLVTSPGTEPSHPRFPQSLNCKHTFPKSTPDS